MSKLTDVIQRPKEAVEEIDSLRERAERAEAELAELREKYDEMTNSEIRGEL